MELNEFVSLIKAKRQTITSIIVIFMCLSAVITFVQPLKFGSVSQLIIIQKTGTEADAYNQIKSAEHLSNVLSSVVVSQSFYQRVMDAGYDIDAAYFSGNTNDQNKKWKKTVEAKALNDSGIIEISVYHADKNQLEKISQAVIYVLKTEHANYHGYGNNIELKVINEPVISRFPVKPNILLNFFLALIAGIVFALGYIYYLPGADYDVKIWPKKRTKSIVYSNVAMDGAESNWHSVKQVLEKEEVKDKDQGEAKLSERDFYRGGDMKNLF